jgi:MarC family membrane protein
MSGAGGGPGGWVEATWSVMALGDRAILVPEARFLHIPPRCNWFGFPALLASGAAELLVLPQRLGRAGPSVAHQIESFLRMAALTVATLLPIINPPGGAPIFLSMTPGASDTTRSLLARRVGLDSLLLLSVAMLIGSHVLGFFGLSLSIVKIAGGLLVVANGWRLINADASTDARPVDASPPWGAEEIARRAFYPLTFPLTVGPGSLSVAVTLGAGSHMSGMSMLTASWARWPASRSFH